LWVARAPLHATPTTGIQVTVSGTVVQNFDYSGVNIGILVSASDVRIRHGRIHDLISDGSNGSGIVVENGAWNVVIEDVEIDGSNSQSDGAGVFLAPGSAFARLRNVWIHHHPTMGLAIGSTTYAEFAAVLPASYAHDVQDCLIDHCGYARSGGDASSGIAIVGQSNQMTIKNNDCRYNKGAEIAVSGSLKDDGSIETPKLTESPTQVLLDGNRAS
jgi:hypothetical protein